MMKTEAVVKTDLAINWEKAVNYVPAAGTIIIYEYKGAAPRIKMGDGVTKVNALPFLVAPPCINQETLEL